MVLVLAPAAMAQNGGAQEGLESFCPDGGFPAAPQGVQQGGPGELLCFPTQEQAQTFNQTGEIQGNGPIYNPSTGEVIRPAPMPGGSQGEQDPGAGEMQYDGGAGDDQYAPPEEPEDTPDEMQELPDTGGIGLGGAAAGLGVALVAGGLLLRGRLN